MIHCNYQTVIYIGSTVDFKRRYCVRINSFINRKEKFSTSLATHTHNLKVQNIQYKFSCSIVAEAIFAIHILVNVKSILNNHRLLWVCILFHC